MCDEAERPHADAPASPATPPRPTKRRRATRTPRRRATTKHHTAFTDLSGAPALAPVGDYVVTCTRRFICADKAWRRQYTLTSAADLYTFAQLAAMPLPNAVREIARTAFPGARASRVFIAVGEPATPADAPRGSARGFAPLARRAYLPELEAFGADVPTLGAALGLARHGEVEGACRSPLYVGCDESEMELVLPDDDGLFDPYVARLFGDGAFGARRVELRDHRNRTVATLTPTEDGGVHLERHAPHRAPPASRACRAVAVGVEASVAELHPPRARVALFHATRSLPTLDAAVWLAAHPSHEWLGESGGSLGNAPPSVVFHAVMVRRWRQGAAYARNFSADLIRKIADFCGDEAVVPRRTRVFATLTLAPYVIHLRGTETRVKSTTVDTLAAPCRRAFERAVAARASRRRRVPHATPK